MRVEEPIERTPRDVQNYCGQKRDRHWVALRY
jgi:hypothetical protein